MCMIVVRHTTLIYFLKGKLNAIVWLHTRGQIVVNRHVIAAYFDIGG